MGTAQLPYFFKVLRQFTLQEAHTKNCMLKHYHDKKKHEIGGHDPYLVGITDLHCVLDDTHSVCPGAKISSIDN